MKQGLRRIAAYLIDYGVILIWIGLLFGAASTGLLGFHSADSWTTCDRWIAQGQGFLAMTLPVYLYFTLFEAFGAKATFGKRALRF
ncbi:MAG: RDD family protein, partial [Pseudomonadota bacterium]